MLSRVSRTGVPKVARRLKVDKALKAASSLDVSGPKSRRDSFSTTLENSIFNVRFQHLPPRKNIDSGLMDVSSFPWTAPILPTFIQNTSHRRQLIPISSSWERDFDYMSEIFLSTMLAVLRRASSNFMNSDLLLIHHHKELSTSFVHDNSNHSSSFGNGMGIQYRHFSTTPKPSEGKDDAKIENLTPVSSSPLPPVVKGAPIATTQSSSTSAKIQAMVISTIKSLATLFAKIPGVLWFYLTHPIAFKEKMIELKEAAKKEAHHYYMGSKLLMADIRTARTIIGQTLNGTPLSRRERKQLLRTVTDVFRLVPMSIFVLIPFMEFALPFALKLFPNMLPSTFQDSLKEEEKMKRELKSRIAMAEFFQE